MAKLEAHGQELFRYYSVRAGGLLAVMNDGTKLIRRVGGDWKVHSRKKADVSLEDWRAAQINAYTTLTPWKKAVTTLPSLRTLQRWEEAGVCETPTGHRVEPDGVGPDGVPSWLRVLGMI